MFFFKVAVVAFLFATFFKKSNDLDIDSENDHEDDGKSLNKYYKPQNYKHVNYLTIIMWMR